MESEDSLPYSKELAVTFCNKLILYGKELLAHHPIPCLEGNPLSDVRDCLFSM
jgi:hypothetical protein